ncbi:MAG: YraN family protein [Alphaproteobacteria bacterium]|jgi:putative endonuclease
MKATNKRKQSYRFGIHAEKLAAWYLRAKGYSVIAERYRNVMGEIDVLAIKRNTLVAIEVKARKTMQACEESITPHKQMRVSRAMEAALADKKITGLARTQSPNIRFDVIWITPWHMPKHIKDAWRP